MSHPTGEAVQAGCDARCEKSPPSLRRRVRARWQDVKTWLHLNIWCRHLYRRVMPVLHRFNLHYAPPSPISPEFGYRDHWCQWCGLRGKTFKVDPSRGLEQFKSDP